MRTAPHLAWLWACATLACCLLAPLAGAAESNTLREITYATLPGERLQVVLKFAQPPRQPSTFAIDNPARISLDFTGTRSTLPQRTQNIGVGVTRSVTAVEARDRTRVVFNLSRLASYQTAVRGNEVIVTIERGVVATPASSTEPAPAMPAAEAAAAAATIPVAAVPTAARTVSNVDFRRGTRGEGRVVITLSDPKTPIDMRDQSGQIVIDLADTQLPKQLERRLDVTDFATPVTTIESINRGQNARITVALSGDYDQMSYQTDNILTIEALPLTKEQAEARLKDRFPYTGERLSLNFQDIEVRSVLSLIGDFTGLNVVIDDSVSGNITLRLKDVPWDQALDIILKTKNLDKRESGNVLFIAPRNVIAERERLELESSQQVRELAPLRLEFIQINYAKASEIAALLKAKENQLLSERGNVTVDTRTNTLLVQDTSDNLSAVRNLIKILDVPVRQVMIESRIVIASETFSRELGVRFGGAGVRKAGSDGIIVGTGSGEGASGGVGQAITNLNNTGQPFPVTPPSYNDRLAVNLPIADPAGRLALAILGSNFLVDLELQALQAEGRGEVVSNPRVITSNQQKAEIKQGVEIPYQEQAGGLGGGTSVSFKEAVLSLEVTPQITPDDRINMEIRVNKDRPDFSRQVNGVPPIETRSVNTNVLVENGQTVVLGGIYEQETTDSVTKVPLLGDLPIVGNLFRSKGIKEDKNELLIFVTPKLIGDNLSAFTRQ
ncbi:MAG: type IV pilus secretin PilQ [Chromatiales bacterium]|nr:type IV pilus secretin PilQ [Chromatiales bacterium]